MPGGPNGAALGPDGLCYVCNNGGFAWHEDAGGLRPAGQGPDYSGGRLERIDLRSGVVERLYDRTSGGSLRGRNDLVFDRAGGCWFTDAGKGRAREIDRGGVYYAAADGSGVREAVFPMLVPNGIGLSPDESRLYVAETATARLWAFDLSGPGEIARQPWPSPQGGTLLTTIEGNCGCDSLAVDAAGNICIAMLFDPGIRVIAPDGTQVEHVPMPDLYTTNIAFGGPGLRTAYITLSQSGRLVAMDWPRPGLRLNFTQDWAGGD